MYRYFIKTVFDFISALIALILSSPIIIIVGIILFIVNDGKPFFIQPRPGKNGKSFKLLKFKTMRDLTDENGKLLSDSKRMTKIGRLIRSSSIDELPQLINVLKGDMSIIGPRPLLEKYISLYNSEQARRHEVRPGITGWAQVNGRNNLNWSEKFKLDCYYVDNLSIGLDIKILFKTIKQVISRDGINSSEGNTMMEFTGNDL